MKMTFDERVATLKETLVNRFGYGRREAGAIAEEAMTNLDRHVKLQELAIKRIMEARR
jgi:hypothetical protein